MKKYCKNIIIYTLVFVLSLAGSLTNMSVHTSATTLKSNGYISDYEPVDDDYIQNTEMKYYSIQNAYIAKYTSSSITFSWYSGGNNDGFYVYRKCQYDEKLVQIGTVKNVQYSTHTFKDTNFKRGFSFGYYIVPYFVDATTGDITTKGGVSTTFKATLNSPKSLSIKRNGKKATLSWKKTGGADGYEIYRKNAGGSYKKVKTIQSGSTLKWTAKGISKSSTTKFKVRAFSKYGNNYSYSSYSTEKMIYSISTQKIANKIKKLKKKYPSGKYWNHVGKKKYSSSTITNKPCNHYKKNRLSTCNHYNCPNGVIGYQCYGFAWKMSDLIYGKTAKYKNFRSFKKCKMGDVIRYSGHSVIITEKHKDYVVVGECNIGGTCIISWGRKIYKSSLKGAVYSRRYR